MAEGLTFTVGGNGILGDVEPGWSEQEFATPVNPNERAGGTGTVSFAAKDVAAGVLAINKAITSEDAALGQVSGVVRTASKTGQRVAITHDNKLAKYNAVRTMPPMIAASVPDALDLGAMQAAGDLLVGEHDFSSFCRKPKDRRDEPLVRRVTEVRWERADRGGGWDSAPVPDGDVVRLAISASAFCHQMVRSIVGALVRVGRGRMTPDEVAALLAGRDRAGAPNLAPPQGLTLWEVGYAPWAPATP